MPWSEPSMTDNPFRHLPAVHDVLQVEAIQSLAGDHAHEVIVAAVRQELAECRQRVSQGAVLDGQTSAEALAGRVVVRLGRELQPKLRTVINATGIVLHTN